MPFVAYFPEFGEHRVVPALPGVGIAASLLIRGSSISFGMSHGSTGPAPASAVGEPTGCSLKHATTNDDGAQKQGEEQAEEKRRCELHSTDNEAAVPTPGGAGTTGCSPNPGITSYTGHSADEEQAEKYAADDASSSRGSTGLAPAGTVGEPHSAGSQVEADIG